MSAILLVTVCLDSGSNFVHLPIFYFQRIFKPTLIKVGHLELPVDITLIPGQAALQFSLYIIIISMYINTNLLDSHHCHFAARYFLSRQLFSKYTHKHTQTHTLLKHPSTHFLYLLPPALAKYLLLLQQ